MLRRNFLKAVAALVASPALLLKKRKREADRSVQTKLKFTVVPGEGTLPMDMSFVTNHGDGLGGWSAAPQFPPDVFEAIKGIETEFDKQVGLSDVILYGKSKV